MLSGGMKLWPQGSATATMTVTIDATGYYSTTIAGSTSGVPFPTGIFDGNERFLGITVGSDPEMTPRQPLDSVPYALRALLDATLGEGLSSATW